MGSQKLNGQILSGLIWSSVQLLISRSFAFVIKLILAKLLFPAQFGLVGMAIVFTSFVQIFNDLGIGAALVQRKEENLTDLHFHTAFWTGVLWSIGIYILIVFAVAPLASIFYKEPMLKTIIPVLSIGVLCSPINLIHRAQLTRQLHFKKLASIKNVSSITSGLLAVVLALMGAGIWALVFNTVTTFIVAMPLYFKATGWLPKLQWSNQAFKDVFSFGVFTSVSEFFNVLLLNLDYLLVGKLLGATALGVYTLAFVLTDTFRNQLTKMINKVMYPVYGQNQEDLNALRRMYFKVVKYNSLLIYPMMTFLIVLGEPFIIDLFGAKWIESILPLKILAVSVMIHLLVNSHAMLIRGLGKTKIEMRMQLIKAVFYAPSIILGIYFYGIVGAASAYVLNKVFEVVIAQYFLKKFLNITLADVISAVSYPLMAGTVAFIVTFLLYNSGIHYYLCTIALAISYSFVIWLTMKVELIKNLKNIKQLTKKKALRP